MFFILPTDQRSGMAPLFETRLDLQASALVFSPSLELEDSDSLFEVVESLINDVFKMSSLVPRVAQHSPSPHYQVKLAGRIPNR